MLSRLILGATLLLSSTVIAAPVEASTQAAQASPAEEILRQTAARLRGTVARLDALNGNPALAASLTGELSSISQGVDTAAAQLDAGEGLGILDALSFLPVLTSLIGAAKSVTDEINAKKQFFNPPAIAGALDQNYRAVQHLKAAFDDKLPDAYNWIINGLSSGTLRELGQTRDSFAAGGFAAPYPAAYPAGYPAPTYPAAGYPAPRPLTQPLYGAAPAAYRPN